LDKQKRYVQCFKKNSKDQTSKFKTTSEMEESWKENPESSHSVRNQNKNHIPRLVYTEY